MKRPALRCRERSQKRKSATQRFIQTSTSRPAAALIVLRGEEAALSKSVATEATRDQMTVPTQWEHAHQCQVCGYIVRIDDLDAKVIAAGIVSCQKCDASGPVNVKIVDARQISHGIPALRGKG